MQNTNKPLGGLNLIVIGAGPGGLIFARSASRYGANVKVIEKAGDPRGNNPGYTDRSFNLTLNQVGRRILDDPRVWVGGAEIIGRAVHNFKGQGSVKYSEYGGGEPTILTSVPRPVLRQNLVKIVEEEGVDIQFDTPVIAIDPNVGQVTIKQSSQEEKLTADAVIVADGINSLADQFIAELPSGSLHKRQDRLAYISVLLDSSVAKDLSKQHMHFWHKLESESVAIGMPNGDGSVAVLLISPFEDVADGQSPFTTLDQSISRLRRDFPELLSVDPDLPQKVQGRKLGHFHYKSISNYVLGKKSIVVGDAGSASPPWAGFGANTAIYSADSLARFMAGCAGDIDLAFSKYEQHKLILAKFVLEYADEHGEFLNKKVAKNPEERPIGPVLGQLVNQAIELSDITEGVELLSF